MTMNEIIMQLVMLEEHPSMPKGFQPTFQKVIESISEMPEVVLCKDCKHYLDSNEKCALIDTRLNFYATDKRWNGDSFCSWADMRGDAE